VRDFLRWFITSPEENLYNVRRGQWECRLGNEDVAHMLLFHSRLRGRIRNASDCVCVRPYGSKRTLFNASRITYGQSWRDQQEPQRVAEDAGAIPVPFETVVAKEHADMDLAKLKLVHWAGSERMYIPPINRNSSHFHVVDRHFAGATIVRVDQQHFLFDTDRQELESFGFNPFFAQLSGTATTIEDAYVQLQPAPVREAAEAGKEIRRQGEFFFVRVDDEEVRSKVAKTDCDKFFFDQLTERLKLMGAAVINCDRVTTAKDVDAYVRKCAQQNKGMMIGGEDRASDILQDYRARLKERVGPASANPPAKDPTVRPNSPYYRGSGASHSDTHMNFLYEELVHRSRQDNRILFQARIGSETGGRWTRQHVATGVFNPSEDVAYAIGAVIHTGREHKHCYLPGWYRVYPNTAIVNFTVSGDVD
jgi:hypothetical protein